MGIFYSFEGSLTLSGIMLNLAAEFRGCLEKPLKMGQLFTAAGFHHHLGHELLKEKPLIYKQKCHSHDIQLRALLSTLTVKGKRKHTVADRS